MASQSPQVVRWYPPTTSGGPSAQSNALAVCSLGVVEFWHYSSSISYRVGTFNDESQQISWGSTYPHVDGINPSVAVNDNGVVVEVHQSQNNAGLWIYAGVVDFDLLTIQFNYVPKQSYDDGTN